MFVARFDHLGGGLQRFDCMSSSAGSLTKVYLPIYQQRMVAVVTARVAVVVVVVVVKAALTLEENM